MGQNVRTGVFVSSCALVLGLLLLFCFNVLPVAHSQTKPGPPGAPPVTVSAIEISPKTLPLYTEYTGTTDALDTVEIRARVDGYIEQKLFHGGQVIKAGEHLYLLDQRTFSAEVQKAKADLQFAKEGVEVFRAESRLAQSRAALDDFVKASARTWSIGANALQPIFNYGRIRSINEATQASYLGLLAQYEQTIQTAFREVSDALVGYRKSREQRVQQEHLVESLQDRVRLANKRFFGGLDNYLQVLDA